MNTNIGVRLRRAAGHYTMRDVAEKLGVTYRQMWSAVRRGFLPKASHKVKGYKQLYYNADDLDLIEKAITKVRVGER